MSDYQPTPNILKLASEEVLEGLRKRAKKYVKDLRSLAEHIREETLVDEQLMRHLSRKVIQQA